MAMKSVTNNSLGPRVVHGTLDGKSAAEHVVLQPGETRDMDPVASDAFQGMVDAKDLIVGKAGTKPETAQERSAREAAEAEADASAREEAAYKRGWDLRDKAKAGDAMPPFKKA